MLENWDTIEAEFQRDYHINLVTEITTMTWRRFSALLNNLKPDGVLGLLIRLHQQKEEENKEITPAELGAYF